MNSVNFADEAVKSESVFRLISESGEDVSSGERGMLLYKGGTVCGDTFSHYSANAICREMGYQLATNWTSGYLYDIDFQEGFYITLAIVWCENDDWKSCSYKTTHYCYHWQDVFLNCSAGR